MIPESSSFVPMLDQVKTVQDLVNLNNQQPEQPEQQSDEAIVGSIIDTILDHEPSVGIQIANKILVALEQFHNEGVQLYIDKNEADIAAQWAFDAAKLKTAREAIRDIQL